jgi:hypothetical protein
MRFTFGGRGFVVAAKLIEGAGTATIAAADIRN